MLSSDDSFLCSCFMEFPYYFLPCLKVVSSWAAGMSLLDEWASTLWINVFIDCILWSVLRAIFTVLLLSLFFNFQNKFTFRSDYQSMWLPNTTVALFPPSSTEYSTSRLLHCASVFISQYVVFCFLVLESFASCSIQIHFSKLVSIYSSEQTHTHTHTHKLLPSCFMTHFPYLLYIFLPLWKNTYHLFSFILPCPLLKVTICNTPTLHKTHLAVNFSSNCRLHFGSAKAARSCRTFSVCKENFCKERNSAKSFFLLSGLG